jgi:hypothetical protein
MYDTVSTGRSFIRDFAEFFRIPRNNAKKVRKKLREYLDTHSFEGSIGAIEFDSQGKNIGSDFHVWQVDKGVPVKLDF